MTYEQAVDTLATAEHFELGEWDISDMTKEEVIQAAEECDLHSDAAYDAWKERFT